MRCRRARAWLPALLDHGLPAPQEAAVRAHADGCPACADALAEHRAAEALLLRLPVALAGGGAPCDARLAALARWAAPPEPPGRARLRAPAVGAFAAAALIALLVTLSGWSPVVEEPLTYRTYAAMLPDSSFAPTGWR